MTAAADLQSGYLPGVIGRVTELHARYYAEHWSFGAFFEARVASELAAFMGRYDPARDRFLAVMCDDRLEGTVTIDGIDAHGDGAHLRWFILSDALRGQGWGHRLIDAALAFCREQRYPRVYLWTFAGLDAARRLYEGAGFELTREFAGDQWGTPVTEQRFEIGLR